jgi:hypothetical protein
VTETIGLLEGMATTRAIRRFHAGCLIEMGRHLLADVEALREAFYGKSDADAVTGGAP